MLIAAHTTLMATRWGAPPHHVATHSDAHSYTLRRSYRHAGGLYPTTSPLTATLIATRSRAQPHHVATHSDAHNYTQRRSQLHTATLTTARLRAFPHHKATHSTLIATRSDAHCCASSSAKKPKTAPDTTSHMWSECGQWQKQPCGGNIVDTFLLARQCTN